MINARQPGRILMQHAQQEQDAVMRESLETLEALSGASKTAETPRQWYKRKLAAFCATLNKRTAAGFSAELSRQKLDTVPYKDFFSADLRGQQQVYASDRRREDVAKAIMDAMVPHLGFEFLARAARHPDVNEGGRRVLLAMRAARIKCKMTHTISIREGKLAHGFVIKVRNEVNP